MDIVTFSYVIYNACPQIHFLCYWQWTSNFKIIMCCIFISITVCLADLATLLLHKDFSDDRHFSQPIDDFDLFLQYLLETICVLHLLFKTSGK